MTILCLFSSLQSKRLAVAVFPRRLMFNLVSQTADTRLLRGHKLSKPVLVQNPNERLLTDIASISSTRQSTRLALIQRGCY